MSRSQRRYGGRLIFHARDEEGALEIVETHGVRSLHFGTAPRQSAMALDEPDRVELAYVRAMLTGLSFVPDPERVLLLGLGGGTLASFLLRHFPRCQVDAVERRAAVVTLAYNFFALPKSERLRITVGEAKDYVARHTGPAYDLIFVDAYDERGMDASINAEAFFRDCARSSSARGAMVINLWGTHTASLRLSTQLLRLCYPQRCFRLAVPNRGNIIGFGLGEEVTSARSLQHYLPRAQELEARLGLEMPYFLRNLKPL